MADKILTLCDRCAELMRSGYDVQQINSGSIWLPLRGRKCDNCGQTFGVMRRYSVSRKRGGNG